METKHKTTPTLLIEKETAMSATKTFWMMLALTTLALIGCNPQSSSGVFDDDSPGDDDVGDDDDDDTGGDDDTASDDDDDVNEDDVPTSDGTNENSPGDGGGVNDFGIPSQSVTISGVPWISQKFDCGNWDDWDSTKTCGPTSTAMTISYITGEPLDSFLVQELVESLNQSWPCGSVTNTDMLAGLLDDRGILYSLKYFDANDVVDAMLANHPIITPVYTQNTATGQMDLVNDVGHFMVIVGVTSTQIIANDPGRSSESNGSYHPFTLDDYIQAWYENGSFRGIEVISAGSICSCTDQDQDGYYSIDCNDQDCYPATDCDDNNANIHPGVTEQCDGVDSNCSTVDD